MRKFNITVNGKTYEVEVEEVGGVSAPAKMAPISAPKASVPAAAPNEPAAQPKAQAPVTGGESVTAPMPGKVFKVIKGEGTQVKNGEVVMILEAMKMENEITAPLDGTVQQIAAKEGTAVNPGDVLFIIG
ncbi:MAG: hypothetical protein VR72_21010 [Clostridiaceae bacterium BRH_c20a]|nr:MAG: hypothetical protein VR72_21010 [Clostridiaceae bacterium BRH_c20a]